MSFRLASVCLPAAVAVAAALSSKPSAAAEICISPAAEQALSSCAGIKPKEGAGKRRELGLHPPPPARTSGPAKPPRPIGPGASGIARRELASVRAQQLLVAEIQGLESLVASTPKKAPDRPKLLRRLADDYVELEAAAQRGETEAQIRRDEARRRKDARAATTAEAEAKKSASVAVAARGAAIKRYTELSTGYPSWCASASADPAKASGCADEVLYDLAYEHEQAGQLAEARKVYFELVQRHPTSRYVPHAYLAFGELFFGEAAADASKYALAEQSYAEVVKYPAPANRMEGYAHYKLAYVYWNQGDHAKALTELRRTIDIGQRLPSLAGAAQLADAARRDLIPIYAVAGDPKKAHDFLQPLAGDARRTLRMMDDLGRAYLDTGHYADAIDLYEDLLRRDREAGGCAYQGRITEATLALRSGNKAAIRAELDRQLEARARFVAGDHPAEAELACDNVTASLVLETAMAWHLEAVGSHGVRGTGDRKTMSQSAELYTAALKAFGDGLARVEYPRIVKEDWPTASKVRYLLADLLYAQNDWRRCGPAFDEVVAADPSGPDAGEAAFTAAVCYEKVYFESHAGRSDRAGRGAAPTTAEQLAPIPMSDAQKAMVSAFDRFVCYVHPAAGDKAGKEQLVEIKYARARTYFEAHRWEEAAVGFRDVALSHPDTELGPFASALYLESLNVLASSVEPARPACLDRMGEDVPKLAKLYCDPKTPRADADQCTGLARVARDLERRGAERMVAEGMKGGPGALKKLEQGATAYMELWTRYGDEACSSRQPSCDRMEEVLYNAARAYQAARLVAKAIAVRKILVDPRYRLHETGPAKKALYEIGSAYQSIAVYDEAASWYERFAREAPAEEKAPEALKDAVVLRLGAGEHDQGLKDAELFARSFGAKQPAQAAQIAFAVGAHQAEREDWAEAKRRLAAAMPRIDTSATLDVKVEAHATLGRAYARTGDAARAAAEYGKVRSLVKDSRAVEAKLAELGGEAPEKARRLGKVLTALGEAAFFAAEQRRKEVDAIRFPEYRGPGTRADVLAHVNGPVAEWIRRKRPMVEAVEREYLKVLDIQPVPPRWAIAAGARVGQMWGKFVAEFRAAPIPREWLQHGPSPYGGLTWDEIRAAYYEEIDRASEPQRLRAKGAYKACLDYSLRYQHFDASSRACEAWLSKNYGAEYHLVDELRAAPSRVGAGLAARARGVEMGGAAVRVD